MKKDIVLSSLNQFFPLNPFGLFGDDRIDFCLRHYLKLAKFHYLQCHEYRRIIDVLDLDLDSINKIESLPFIPVRLFKKYDLRSVPKDEILKTLTSSGTTGQSLSKIFLDRETVLNQSKILAKIVGSSFGNKRRPMLIIDSSAVIKDRRLFSARGAGILGFSMLGHGIVYALDENMELRIDAIKDFLKKYADQEVLIFGFTFIIWKHFYEPLAKLGLKLSLDRGILIHGGGWKKLHAQSISNSGFKAALEREFGIKRVANYYGMVEQTGSIFIECEYGKLHSSIYSDIIVRRPVDFSVCPLGEEGVVQTLSAIPTSYPGYSLLTEDVGRILGVDDCQCGRSGKYFEIAGRVAEAEVRGCSDTYI
jgi:phenylacetate-coenzyme A ligase PaaK-like adenylate-forming protein